jgi:hypothetical protein
VKTPIVRSTIVALGVLYAAGCSPLPEVTDAGEPRKCVGGVLKPDGTCEAKCDPSRCVANNTCVGNKCVLKCSSHTQCQRYSQSCLPTVEDDTQAAVNVCTNVETVFYGDPCPFGEECAAGLYCNRTGPGDGRSYCTPTCLADPDCPAGYECGFVRDPRELCGVSGLGESSLCGGENNTEPCLDTSVAPTDNSGEFVRGAICLQHRLCLKKEACAQCQTDLDCSWAGLDCVSAGADGKRCFARCIQDSDCDADKLCGEGHCIPKAGSCTGDGFCSGCRSDMDCTFGFTCYQLHGNEKGCVDLRTPTSGGCTSDLDCPLSPGGRRGLCISGGRCLPPLDQNTNALSCW